jgi:hypothetical protein
MKSGRFFKTGHTNAVGRRERELAIQLPQKVKVVHEIKTDAPQVLKTTGTGDLNPVVGTANGST